MPIKNFEGLRILFNYIIYLVVLNGFFFELVCLIKFWDAFSVLKKDFDNIIELDIMGFIKPTLKRLW